MMMMIAELQRLVATDAFLCGAAAVAAAARHYSPPLVVVVVVAAGRSPTPAMSAFGCAPSRARSRAKRTAARRCRLVPASAMAAVAAAVAAAAVATTTTATTSRVARRQRGASTASARVPSSAPTRACCYLCVDRPPPACSERAAFLSAARVRVPRFRRCIAPLVAACVVNGTAVRPPQFVLVE